MTPAKIVNNYPYGEQFGRIPLNALPALNINLTDRERKLLQFYICQRTGFAPSAKTIELYTGISPKKLSETRKGLEEAGFIQLKNIREGCSINGKEKSKRRKDNPTEKRRSLKRKIRKVYWALDPRRTARKEQSCLPNR